jgi:hypothetical protein
MGSGARMISVTAPVVMPPPPRCIVPNVKGKSRTTAVALLRRAHCSVGKVKAPRKPRRRAGRHRKWVLVVSRESPGARTSLAAGSGVSLTMAWEAVRR